jgi:uncharacterized protein YjbI with pentapeptide repeats
VTPGLQVSLPLGQYAPCRAARAQPLRTARGTAWSTSLVGIDQTGEMSNAQRQRLATAPYRAEVEREAFDGADLSSVTLDRLRLNQCSLVAADLRHAMLDNCLFTLCDLRRANLRGASLRFAYLSGCDLRDADLRDCDLTGARFGFVNTGDESGQTDMTGTAMEGTVLRDTTFDRVVGWPPT